MSFVTEPITTLAALSTSSRGTSVNGGGSSTPAPGRAPLLLALRDLRPDLRRPSVRPPPALLGREVGLAHVQSPRAGSTTPGRVR